MKPAELTCTSIAITAKGLDAHAWVVDIDDENSPWRVSWMPRRDLTRQTALEAMRVAARRLPRLGPVQAGAFLALAQFQIDRAETMPGLPPMHRRQWSGEQVLAIASRIDEVLAYVGTVPDLGAHRAAEYLTGKLDQPVSAAGVTELARQGRIQIAGHYKGHPLYSGHSLEAFADTEAAAAACEAGRELTADEAAVRLGIRRTDFDHLTRAGITGPAGTWPTRYGTTVPYYRVGDLDRIEADRPAIDWAAVRATPKGRPSPLAGLPAANDQPETRPERRPAT
ncbi:hypothetical protein [Glycomyces salinus]|uniref:hypothetical protein n=1 Tax=Glycomyces salinus TaxID=980294 RepID=UPI0018EB3A3E|nr:hypothetical protein [Glycomyces salinus]